MVSDHLQHMELQEFFPQFLMRTVETPSLTNAFKSVDLENLSKEIGRAHV